MATPNPDPAKLPARDPGILWKVIDGDDVDQWEVYRNRADAVAAADQAAPRMATGYCKWCALGDTPTDGIHYLQPDIFKPPVDAVPCTGEHAPGLRDRPTQYCFWCSIGSPTDERGQHHVDGDIHQCTGQQVPQAKLAEATVLARLIAERDALKATLDKGYYEPIRANDRIEMLRAERDAARAERAEEKLREAQKAIFDCLAIMADNGLSVPSERMESIRRAAK